MLTLACWLVATDGLVYLVSSATGCTDWVDIGEQSYSMALLDDLDGNGYMDLMVTTMNGNAFALQTMVRRPASFSLLLCRALNQLTMCNL